MGELRQYALSIVTAALICGMLLSIAQSGSSKELIRLLCSVFLAVTVLRPLSGNRLELSSILPERISKEGTSYTAAGENMARQAAAQRISAQTEAYILDKASRLGTDLTVTVIVGDDLLPQTAELQGQITPQDRETLSRILTEDLGIAKENQLWSG